MTEMARRRNQRAFAAGGEKIMYLVLHHRRDHQKPASPLFMARTSRPLRGSISNIIARAGIVAGK